MQNLHWDYADSFSGRDAAYLISGFDPSSNISEDAYRAQPVIKRLKKAYYFACSEIRKTTDWEGHKDENMWHWLHKYPYNPTALLSVELEGLIAEFMSSQYVTSGTLQRLESFELRDETAFPKYAELCQLEEKKARLRKEIFDKCLTVDPNIVAAYEAASDDYDKYKKEEYLPIVESIASDKRYRSKMWRTREAIFEKSREVDPLLVGEYENNNVLIEGIELERSVWSDAKSIEYRRLMNESNPSPYDAQGPANEWRDAESHEFDDQRFSRTELHRWITDNRLPSEYEFGDVKPIPCEVKIYPWGAHSTILLEHLSKAANKFWSNYDPTDFTTAPTNDQVEAWLVQQNVPKRTAEVMATILRADGLQTGRRR